MAKMCCVCGKKMSLLELSHELSAEHFEYRICEECHIHIYDFISSSNLEAMDRSRMYFEQCTTNFDIDLKVASELNHIIEKSYSKQKERLEQKAYQATLNDDKIEKEKKDYNTLLINMNELKTNSLMTSGYEFSGYNIIAYHGMVSGEVVMGTGFVSEISVGFSDFFGMKSDQFANKLKSAKDAAKIKLMESAVTAGGNAVIGVDFDYVVFGNNVIGVSANGTSVEVEKKV